MVQLFSVWYYALINLHLSIKICHFIKHCFSCTIGLIFLWTVRLSLFYFAESKVGYVGWHHEITIKNMHISLVCGAKHIPLTWKTGVQVVRATFRMLLGGGWCFYLQRIVRVVAVWCERIPAVLGWFAIAGEILNFHWALVLPWEVCTNIDTSVSASGGKNSRKVCCS